jgi:hypothetical protein
MSNPIPFSGLFHTPTLEALQARVESLPAKDRAMVYSYVMMTLNACHALVEDEFVDTMSRP